jgi:hypothetical protein
MRHLARTFLSTPLIIGLLAASAGAAGYSHVRDGSVVGANIGWAWTELEFVTGSESVPEAGRTESENAFGGGLRYAFAPNEQFMYGAGLGGWRKSFDINSITLFYFDVVGTWFPGGGGFFLRGSVGYGILDVSVRPDLTDLNVVNFQNGGPSLAAGTGYEFRLSPELALGAAFDFRWISIGDVAGFRDVDALHYLATLQFAYYLF